MVSNDVPVYDSIAFKDMEFDASTQTYWHACPCGDMFVISADELRSGETIAHCNDCSLIIRVQLDGDAKRLLGMGDAIAVDPARGACDHEPLAVPVPT
ncbi:hypothetical protein KFE25_008705 [Diacronema lutheri]|uniref:Diphthamide biosynthesis protein 3 n=2 Tax=Diacronema lutheri TaxID=2081491 RepID=A0A8J5Y313_DIALT|nr:hypothetical protein KFE25_008705 [Diacronema lutheri]